MTASPERPLPTEIGPYRVLGRLGAGGMGLVFRAEHRETGQVVALKTVRDPDPNELSGIRSEIYALSRVKHPGVVRILGGGVDRGLPFYCMELLEGRTLFDVFEQLWAPLRVESQKLVLSATMSDADMLATARADSMAVVTLKPESLGLDGSAATTVRRPAQRWTAAAGQLDYVLTLVRALCEPLAFIHGKGLVHRDLKPSNVFIRPDGTPVLMDFGLVSRFRGAVGRERLEVAGFLVGTAAYMAPEQVHGRFVDARTDLYALGCILYELLTGRRPFQGNSSVELMQQLLRVPAEAPSHLVDGIPPALDDLVLRLLAKKPQDRIGYAEDVAEELGRLGAAAPRPTPPATPYLYRAQMAGRHELLTAVTRHLSACKEGDGGSILLLGGESGAGKTFLAAEAARWATLHEMNVVTGECLQVAVSDATTVDVKEAPLHPMRGFFEALADRCREKGEEETERLLGPRGKLLAPYAADLASLPGQAAHPQPLPLPAEEARIRLFEELARTVGAFADARPMLLVLDDVQWADELTLEFFKSLPDEFFARHRIVVLLIFRSDEIGGDLDAFAQLAHTHRFDLGRLDEAAVSEIAAGMLAMPEPPRPFVAMLRRVSEGNPFFVAEYLRAAVNEGLLQRESGRWRVSGAGLGESAYDSIQLPHSLRELVQRRLGALSDNGATLCRTASVLGRELDLELLLAVTPLDEPTALETLKELVARQVLAESDSGAYRFMHDKLREGAYDLIPPDERRALHLAVARQMEARQAASTTSLAHYAVLAHHFRLAEVWPKTVDYLEKAAGQAVESYSNREAQAHALEALALGEKLPGGMGPLRTGRLRKYLMEAAWGMGDMEGVAEQSESALEILGYKPPRSMAAFVLGILWQVLLRIAVGIVPSLFRLKTPTAHARAREASAVMTRQMDLAIWNTEPHKAVYYGMSAINLGERIDPSGPLARGYAMMSVVLGVTPWKKLALAWGRRAIAIAEQLLDPSTLTYSLVRVGSVPLGTDDFASAYAFEERGLSVSSSTGDRRGVEECRVMLASFRYIQGRFEEALDHSRAMLETAAARGAKQTEAWARTGMAQCLARLGRQAEALEALADTVEWAERQGTGLDVIWARAAAGLARLAGGDLDGAARDLDQALERIQREQLIGFMFQMALSLTADAALSLCEAMADAPAERRAPCLRRARLAVGKLGGFSRLYSFAAPSALLAKGRLALLDGRPGRAERLLGSALAGAERLGLRLEAAQAHRHLATLGGPERRLHLEEAAARFEAMGAAEDLVRVRHELAQAA